MRDTLSPVTAEAGALLRAWYDGQFPSLTTAPTSHTSGQPSAFETERQELLQAVVMRMDQAGVHQGVPAQAANGRDPKIEACLSMLRHLGAQGPARLQR